MLTFKVPVSLENRLVMKDTTETSNFNTSPQATDVRWEGNAAYSEPHCDKTSVVHKTVNGVISIAGRNITEVPSFSADCRPATKLYLDYNRLAHLPDSMFRVLRNLVVCSVIGNDLERLPPCVGLELTNLEELYLNENRLVSLPDSFCKLERLKKLNIVGNVVKFLPCDFGNLWRLRQLAACENLLEELPDSFGKLRELEILELADNNLLSLPDTFGDLQALRTLNLSGNKLRILPDSFGKLSLIKQLDLSENSIDVLPQNFASAGVLEKFFFTLNYVPYLPGWMGDMPRLCELVAEDNRLIGDVIPPQFGTNCRELRILNLAGNQITKLPDSIGELLHLESLHMGSSIDELERRAFQNGNRLSELPDTFCMLHKLKYLRLDENKLLRLPENIGGLCSLEHCDFGQNHLCALPASFCELYSLRSCHFSRNQLESLPDRMHLMVALRDLRLDHNLLESLPPSLGELTKLETLDVFNNRLTVVPTFLHKLTHLKRLDLLENKFQIKQKDIPRVIKGLNYPQRDPRLKDNWRGQVRHNVRSFETCDVAKLDDGEDIDDEQGPDAEPPVSERQLEMAVKRNMSLWRSHNGPTQREIFTKPEFPTLRLDNWTPTGGAERGECEMFGEEDWSETLPTEPPVTIANPDFTEEAGNWEDPDEDSWEEAVSPNYVDPLYRPTCVDPIHYYIPSDTHVKDMEVDEKQSPDDGLLPEDGQFDDTGDEDDADS